MRKIKSLAVLILMVCMGTSVYASGGGYNLITSGDFEEGIKNFGIAYSSRQDTTMPMLFAENTIVRDGKGSLVFVADSDLGVKPSLSAQSMGFAYQGLYYKDYFTLKANQKYIASADIYTDSQNVKMRFVEMDGDKAIAASDEMSVVAERWNSLYYSSKSDKDISKGRLRIVFYNFSKDDRIYIDNFKFAPSAVNDSNWSALSGGGFVFENNVVKFNGKANTDGSILYKLDKKYLNKDEYYASCGITTDADKAYITVSCDDAKGYHANYIVKKGEQTKVMLPLNPKEFSEGIINIKFEILGQDKAVKTEISDFDILDNQTCINIEQSGKNLVFSGVLRNGNEGNSINVSLTDTEDFTIQVKNDGSYQFLQPVPKFDGVYKTIDVQITGIRGYADVNNKITGNYTLVNTEYVEEILEKLQTVKTGREVAEILSVEELDALGISQISVFVTADKNKVFEDIAGKDISTKDKLLKEIIISSCYSSLDKRTKNITYVIDRYEEELGLSNISAYKNLYNSNDENSRIDDIFANSGTTVKSKSEFEYALAEILVKNGVEKSINYSEGIALLKKYKDELRLDFSRYDDIKSSSNRYNVAIGLYNYAKSSDNFSGIQSKINALIDGNGTGSSGSSGGTSKSNVSIFPNENISEARETKNPDRYSFTDLESYSWAEEDIYALLEMGVISKSNDAHFRPSDNITRAEFAKMVAVMGGLLAQSDEEIFNDVTARDWYFPYVTALSENGIIRGIDDSYFGANEYITRQDICVILTRYKNMENDVLGNQEHFTDISDASDYAVGAIVTMKTKGHISGYDDGSFRPRNFAIRAEIAKILYSMK